MPIVATPGLDEDQVPPDSVVESVVDPFEQIAVLPDIVPANGAAVMFTVVDVDTFEQPPVPVIV